MSDATEPANGPVLDIREVIRRLPHRYPFLLIDRVLELVHGERIRALKNITVNEPFFPGHFPSRPVMPGVLIIEAMAQAAGILTFESEGVIPKADDRFNFVGIDKARFRKPVEPGDQLIMNVTLVRSIKGIWKFDAGALVDGYEVASAELMLTPESKGEG